MMNPAVQRSHNSPAAARAGLSLRTYLLIESNRATFKLSAYEHVTEMLSIPLHQLRQEAAALSKAPAVGHRQPTNESENNPVLEFLNLGREPSDEVKILPHLLPEVAMDIPLLPPSSLPFHPCAAQSKDMKLRDLPEQTAPTSDVQERLEAKLTARPDDTLTVSPTLPEAPPADTLDDTDHILLREVGQRIRTLRRGKKLSLDDLADQLNLNATYLQRIEAGQINAAIPTYLKIAHGLDVPSSELFLSEPTTSELDDHVQRSLEQLGNRIRVHRLALGLDQHDFGFKVGMTHQNVHRLEQGRLSVGLETYLRVAAALSVQLSDLLRNPQETADQKTDADTQ